MAAQPENGIERSVDALRANGLNAARPSIAIILGSGLGDVVQDVEPQVRVSYREIPGFAEINVRGHAGELVVGKMHGVEVAVFSGRFHLYEGHSAQCVGFPVRLAHALGAKTLLVANAAGGINNAFAVGDMMVISDQINMTGTSSLLGPLHEGDVRFPDMSDAYDLELQQRLHHAASQLDIHTKSGVYIGILGPAYETRAEIRMFRMIGADAVGMSTIHEVITAKALGLRVAGLSCIANIHHERDVQPLDHLDVLAAAASSAEKFRALVKQFVKGLAAT